MSNATLAPGTVSYWPQDPNTNQQTQAQKNIGMRGIKLATGNLLQQVATRSSQYWYTYSASYSTTTCWTSRTKHYFPIACTGVQLIYTNIDSNGTVVEGIGQNPVDMKVSIETSGGTVIPIWFQGRRLALLYPAVRLMSDPININFAAGDYIWIRCFQNRIADAVGATEAAVYGPFSEPGLLTTTQSYMTYTTQVFGTSFATGEGLNFSNSTSIVPSTLDLTDSGTVTQTDQFAFLPTGIVGYVNRDVSVAVAVPGDSIALGVNDYKAVGDPDCLKGFIRRALEPAAGAKFAAIMLAATGDQMGFWTTSQRAQFRSTMFQYAKFVITNMGINDIFSGGYNFATMQARYITWWTYLGQWGGKILQTTITPYTSSTDQWFTTANQTQHNTTNNLTRISVNQWLRAGAPMNGGVGAAVGVGGSLYAGQLGHPLTGVYDVSSLVETSTDSGIWQAPGVAGSAYTGTLTGATTTTMTVSGASWTVNQWATGYSVYDQTQNLASVIVSNTATVLTLAVSSASYATSDVIYIANILTTDGEHPTTYGNQVMATGINTALLV